MKNLERYTDEQTIFDMLTHVYVGCKYNTFVLKKTAEMFSMSDGTLGVYLKGADLIINDGPSNCHRKWRWIPAEPPDETHVARFIDIVKHGNLFRKTAVPMPKIADDATNIQFQDIFNQLNKIFELLQKTHVVQIENIFKLNDIQHSINLMMQENKEGSI